MSPKFIKFLDKFIGSPICWLLTLVNKIILRKQQPPKRVLFIKLIEQGATVLAYSALKRAIHEVGKENVFFCVFKENRPILDIQDILLKNNIFEFRNKNILLFIYDVFRFMIYCRKNKIDSTIDMEFFSRSSVILAFLSGASNKVGYHKYTSEYPYRGDLLTHKVQYNPYIHVSLAYYLLVDALFDNTQNIPLLKKEIENISIETPIFTCNDMEKKEVINIIENELKHPIERPIILLNPNAGDMLPIRKWDTSNFIRLAKKILENLINCTIILTGAPSEREKVEKILKDINHPNVISLAGKTTLRQLFVLYTISDVLVTNDSGPGHFSSMTDIHSIVLFGPETPLLFGPNGKNTHIIWKKLACSPCVNVFNHRFSPCNNNVCMQMISVDEVYQKIMKILLKNKTELS